MDESTDANHWPVRASGDPVKLDVEGAIRAKMIDPEDAEALRFHLQKLAEKKGSLAELPQELQELLMRVMAWSLAVDMESDEPAPGPHTTLH